MCDEKGKNIKASANDGLSTTVRLTDLPLFLRIL
jgi:hypothetical protein